MATETMTMMVTGGFVTSMIRQAAERGDVLGVLTMVESMDIDDLVGVVNGTKEITGDSVNGYTVEDTGREARSPMLALERQQKRDLLDAQAKDREAMSEAIADWVEITGGHPRDLADGIREWSWYEGSALDPNADRGEEADDA